MFKIGDFVRLKAGWTRMVVVHTGVSAVTAAYCKTGDGQKQIANPQLYSGYTRSASGFVMWKENETKKEENAMPKLYQTKEKTARYGTYLAKNSDGKIVLEMKDSSNMFEAFDPKDVEEVLPWTFYAVVVGAGSGRRHECHYSTKKNAVNVGDLLLSDSGNLYRVKQVNTKCADPKKEFAGARLQTEKL